MCIHVTDIPAWARVPSGLCRIIHPSIISNILFFVSAAYLGDFALLASYVRVGPWSSLCHGNRPEGKSCPNTPTKTSAHSSGISNNVHFTPTPLSLWIVTVASFSCEAENGRSSMVSIDWDISIFLFQEQTWLIFGNWWGKQPTPSMVDYCATRSVVLQETIDLCIAGYPWPLYCRISKTIEARDTKSCPHQTCGVHWQKSINM